MAYEGLLTRAELIEEVNKNLGGRGSEEDLFFARTIRHLNLAQIRIAREPYRWRELEDFDTFSNTYTGVVNNDAFVDLHDKLLVGGAARDLHKVYSLMLIQNQSTDHPLVGLNPWQWDRMFPDARSYDVAGSAQDLTHFVQWRNIIQIYKVPNASYTFTVRYTFWPAALTDDAQKSNLRNKDDMIIAMATHSLFRSLGAIEDGKEWFGIYKGLLAEAAKDAGDEPALMTQPVGPLETIEGASPGEYWRDPFYRG